MGFARRVLLIFCFMLPLAILLPRFGAAQAASQPAASQAGPQATAPPQQTYTLPPDKLAKAIALSRIRNILGFAGSLWGLAVLWLLLATRAAKGLERWTERLVKQRWLQGLIFFAAFIVISTLASLPLDWYGQHVSLSYGISVQSWGSWLGDQGKSLALGLLFLAPILLLFNWIVGRWPRRYWLAAWVITLPLLVLIIFVSPLLEPIFNQFEPLASHNPALVAKLEQVVARTGTNIPPERMFLMKASLKTNGLNAYVSGMGATKRIVVWDTTAGRIPDDEVLYIFGHESGHYVLRHIPKQLAGMSIFLFFVYWACAGVAAWVLGRCGSRWGAESLASRTGFLVLFLVFSFANFLLEPVGNAFTRHFEHEADVYGQEAVYGIVADPQATAVAAFNKLGEAWLEDPAPSPFIEFWTFSHPSVQRRAEFAAHYNPWANGGRGKFFDK